MKLKNKVFRKATNWKRVLSSMLAAAMVFTSVPATSTVYAAELPSSNVVESTEEMLPVTTVETSSEVFEEVSEGVSEEITSQEPVDLSETEEASSEIITESVDETQEEVTDEASKEPSTELQQIPLKDGVSAKATKNVMFSVKRKGATSASLRGGSFSKGWDGVDMIQIADGHFITANPEALSPGTYSGESGYKFVFNGSTWYPNSGNQTFTVPAENSISIDGNNVTITYYNEWAKSVHIAGGMNNWSDTATAMAGSAGTYTYTAKLSPGYYPYKFVVAYDGSTEWLIDPNCSNFEVETLNNDNSEKDPPNVNSFFIISGLETVTKTVLKGDELELPATLKYVESNGKTSDQSVTYSVKSEDDAEYVTIDGNKITVSQRYATGSMELLATAANGSTSIVTLKLVDKQYTYTIYARSDVDSHMSTSGAALWIWDEAKETSVEAAEYPFTEKVELEDGKEWLKAEVTLPYAKKLGLIYKSAGGADVWTWKATNDLFYQNKLGQDVTLYVVEGENEIFTSLEDIPKESDLRYLLVDYTSASNNYANMRVYAWNNGYEGAEYPIQLVNGRYIAKVPVKKSSANMQIGFILKNVNNNEDGSWNKEGDDNLVTFPANQKYVKVKFQNGAITSVVPNNKGFEVDRSNGMVTFYYRDDELFATNTLNSLGANVRLVVKSSTGDSDIDGTRIMSYDATNERYICTLPLKSETDYAYYYSVNGETILDAFNSRTTQLDGVDYSLFRNKEYEINLNASVKYAQMDYNDNNVLYIDWEAKDGADIEGFAVEEIYANLSALGMGSKVEINKELNAFSFSCKENIKPGSKNIKVTVIDDCDNTYTANVTVTVTERTKTENTETKLGDFDWDEAVIYFAITDRFFDGNTANNTATEGYDASDTTDQSRYHGGDFAGLTQKIDYLYDLGVNTIWITPIVDNVDEGFESDVSGIETYGYHGYWASDFTALNPHLGNEAEFKALIDAAHAKGMKIMVDVVLNHSGYETTDYFNTILKDADGNYIDMIRGAEDTIPGDEKKDGLSGLPDFLTENPEVRKQLVEWQTEWMTKYDIDYYRVDTVKHVENTTWEAFKNSLTESNPDFKMIGEYYDGAFYNTYGQLDSGKMDSILDFGFKYYAENFVTGSISNVEEQLTERNNGINNTAMLGSFLSSHDEDGLLYKLKKQYPDATYWAEALMKVAASLQITAKGQPVIYYGEEIGHSGANNYPYYDNRIDFDWDKVTAQEKDADSMYNHYKKMLNIRRDYSEVFAKGTRTFITGSDAEGYEVIRRTYDGNSVFVGFNIWGDDKTTTFPVTAQPGSVYTDLYSNKTYTVAADSTITVTIPNATKGGTAVFALTSGDEIKVEDTNTIKVKVHYYRADGEYKTSKGDWNVWMWADTANSGAYDLVEEGGDMVATMELEGRKNNSVGFIVRKGDWKEQEFGNRFIDISDVVSGTVHVYVTSGQETFTRVLGADAVLGCKVVSANYERATNNVIVVTSQPITGDPESAFAITRSDGMDIDILNAVTNGTTYTLTIKQDLTSLEEVVKSYSITYEGYEYPLTMPNLYSSDEFESQYTYRGKDLGATWSATSTTFKVWAPTAESVQVSLYEAGDPLYDDRIKTVDMTKGTQGVWTAVVDGDLNGTYYTYLVAVDGKINEACDPYAMTTGVNGKRAMVIDMASTNPEGWENDKGPHTDMNQTDAIIYELHVRDLTIDESAGTSEANRGKYLGVIESGTTTENGVPTGLDHMVDLGITHLHLLPVYDYGSVKEDQLDTPQFNWGYDPVNFNVPEGSYSSDPYNGEVRVKEFKQMVKGLHDNNINVIMDVVYNHVQDADKYCFNQIVPKYFSRTNADGSYNADTGCGNTTASERTMVHKYIVDSILYWHNEYHIDGFRFDLVGLIDAETINAVVNAVHDIDPDIVFYGEGWNMSSGTTKGNIPMATQSNAVNTPGFAYFSDTFRDNLAGNNTNGEGFVLGAGYKEDIMKKCFTAATDWCPGPTQTINYASCHDNYTLMDKLNVAASGSSEADRIKMNNLSAAFYMLSEGVPFIHAGEEFLRTKVDTDGEIIHNSYNSSDYVNKLRWYNLEDDKYADVADYYKGLIEFRKNHEALRLTTASEVSKAVTSYTVENSLLLFNIAGKSKVAGEVSDGIVVIFNANKSAKTVNLSNYGITGDWTVCINGEKAGVTSLGTVNGTATVGAISTLVLVKGELVDTDSVYADNFRETITLDAKSLRLKVGKDATLTPKTNTETTITWSSDNEGVATVENGKVTAVAEGTAVITATTAGGAKATCTVTVTEHMYVISETDITLDLTKDETKTLEVTNEEVDSFTVTWSSSDEDIATVSEAGLVTPVAVGTATITAAIEDGPELTCKVTVTQSVESVEVSPETLELNIGERYTLTAVVTPSGAASAEWYSSNNAVATVNKETGEVYAISEGTVTITAKAGGKTDSCIVTVERIPGTPGVAVPEGIIAITNIHTTLNQVALPEGFSWKYGDIQIKGFAGLNTKNFQAVYTDANGETMDMEIPVSIVTVSKVDVTSSADVVKKGDSVSLTANVVTNGVSIPKDMLSITWKSKKEAVAKVSASASDKFAATASADKKGATQITATVTISDGTRSNVITSAKKKLTVVETELANISFKDLAGLNTTETDGVYAYDYLAGGEAIVKIKVASASTKVTLSSSDAKVVNVGRAKKNAEGDFEAELTFKKAGHVKLKAVANDAAKSQTSIEIYVKDAVPNVNVNTVELNNKSTKATSVYVYPNKGYEIESVSINNADFEVKQVGDTAEYEVSMKKALDKANYKTELSIKMKDVATAYTAPLTIKVASKDAAVTVKQTAKVNLFYTDAQANGLLSVTSPETIESVSLNDCDFNYNEETGELSVKAGANLSALDKKGSVTIYFAEYEPVTKSIKIATENTQPVISMSSKSGVLYPASGVVDSYLVLRDAQTGTKIKADEMEISFKNAAQTAAYAVEKNDNWVCFTKTDASFSAKAIAKIAVRKANYSSDVVVNYTISVNKKDASVVLDKKTVTLNKNSQLTGYEKAVVTVNVKDCPDAGFNGISVVPADAKTTKAVEDGLLKAAITPPSRNVQVEFGSGEGIKDLKGKYKFTVSAKDVNSKDYKSATFTVKVVDTAPEKTVTLKKSGSIDVLNRDTTSLVYKPTLSNITGKVTDVALTGRSAHLFKAELDNGNIKVTVKGNDKEAQNAVNLVTKYNYGIQFVLTLSSGKGTYVLKTGEQKFKLTQSKPTLTVAPKQAVMFNTTSNNEVQVDFSATNKNGSLVAIDRVELTTLNNAFAYDKDSGILSLTGRGEVVKGKTYTLKFNVYYEGYADSEKPASVSLKVKVN